VSKEPDYPPVAPGLENNLFANLDLVALLAVVLLILALI
jgi:hypothetical protein